MQKRYKYVLENFDLTKEEAGKFADVERMLKEMMTVFDDPFGPEYVSDLKNAVENAVVPFKKLCCRINVHITVED